MTKLLDFIARKKPKALRKGDFEGHDDYVGQAIGTNDYKETDVEVVDYEQS